MRPALTFELLFIKNINFYNIYDTVKNYVIFEQFNLFLGACSSDVLLSI